MEIRAIQPGEIEEARGLLLQQEGWRSRFEDAGEFRRLVENSQRALVAVEGGKVVGFVRAVTDGMSNGYLTLLIVANGHRRNGIGRELVAAVLGDNRDMTWILRSDPEAAPFYERIGFTRSQVAMERLRARASDA